MARQRASVAEAKNTLSSLINRVAYGRIRVVLESRGKPKAALVSTEDLERLERLGQAVAAPLPRLRILAQAQALRRKIKRRRKKTLPDSADILRRLGEERSPTQAPACLPRRQAGSKVGSRQQEGHEGQANQGCSQFD
jgi:prevent-host-death family protein